VLIVLGGLGFLVIPELLAVFWYGKRELLPGRARGYGRLGFPRLRFSVQTRLSLVTTSALIVFGTAGFWLLESGQILRGLGVADTFTTSLFQSVTARTAGFNTVTIAELQNATLFLLVLLMVIGGCPVSTAGGIKTVTFAILILGLRALVTRNSRIEAFGRTVPARVVVSALNVFLIYMAAAITGLILVSWLNPQLPMRDVLFECFSALSTVGLSTGITTQLDTGSKIVLCALMFIGRIGPIAMVLSVFQTSHAVDYEFPQEDVVVG
jgi:trk system potassium uptake protein TrkH